LESGHFKMAEYQYKAYISYSHRDEDWAKWLHRALESYRVPRNLVGGKTSAGEVPARIRPVFRDRDDLSSSTDLEGTVKQALAESENLIVVCSPDAAASHWVGEEIRQFADLGRADRIFCIIVGGERADDGSVSACFPAALAEIGFSEPLAADVRKWADGKNVARLKLIAGLLGIRLDELRQRDLQRRRKRQALAGVGIAAVLTLAVITGLSQISERHEREKAEQLATFVVDLGERLQSDADLETLALISAEASRHLQSLDPDKLSPETGKKVALAIRQMGRVSQYQGKPDEALEVFQRSRNLLFHLNKKHPEIPELLFELGNAEYYIGNLHFDQGRYENALELMQSYHRLTRTLLDTDPENPDWILELAYSNNNLAAVQMASGKGINEGTLAHVAEAVRLIEMVVALRPEDEVLAGFYANTLAWAADAQFQSCNLQDTMTLRARVLELSELPTRKDPGNNDLKKQYAYSLTGLARVQLATGKPDPAKQNLELAISVIQQLFAADPSNIFYVKEALYRQIMLVGLLVDTGQFELARPMLKEIRTTFESIGDIAEQGGVHQDEYINFLLIYADFESQSGKVESANSYLRTIKQLQKSLSEPQVRDIYDEQRLAKAKYLWWRLNGIDNFDGFPMIPGPDLEPSSEYRSCIEADSAARMYVIGDERISAGNEVAYLRARGYADPNFIRFCKQSGLCTD